MRRLIVVAAIVLVISARVVSLLALGAALSVTFLGVVQMLLK